MFVQNEIIGGKKFIKYTNYNICRHLLHIEYEFFFIQFGFWKPKYGCSLSIITLKKFRSYTHNDYYHPN